MVDKNGNEIKKGQLILIKNFKHEKGYFFYVEGINEQVKMLYGKRVNKDMSFNRYDKYHNNTKCLLISSGDIIEIEDPLPDKFKESLRTLHYYIDKVLEDFGVLFSEKDHYILRAVQYENGSYGIVQNKLYSDNSCIDNHFEIQNVYEDLTYIELKEKWERIKTHRMNIEWRETFNV